MTIIQQQPPHGSAVARAMAPEDFDRNRESQILEIIAVLVQRVSVQMGSGLGTFEVKPPSSAPELPESFGDLFKAPEPEPLGEDAILRAIVDLEKFFQDTTD